MKRTAVASLALFLSFVPAIAQGRPGSDGAAAAVAAHLAALPFSKEGPYTLTKSQTSALLGLAADLKINVFELLDCSYRYLAPNGFRAILGGNELRSASANFDMGGDRVDALLPIAKTERIEIGYATKSGEQAMDVYLAEKHSDFIELGTAVMDARFGFKRIGPSNFEEAYGIKVQRFPISTELERLELYEPVKVAIYVKALSRPKRWRINQIIRIKTGS